MKFGGDITFVKGYGFPKGGTMDYAGYGAYGTHVHTLPDPSVFVAIPPMDGIAGDDHYGPVQFVDSLGGLDYGPVHYGDSDGTDIDLDPVSVTVTGGSTPVPTSAPAVQNPNFGLAIGLGVAGAVLLMMMTSGKR